MWVVYYGEWSEVGSDSVPHLLLSDFGVDWLLSLCLPMDCGSVASHLYLE